MNLEKLGFVELTEQELKEINGGFMGRLLGFWGWVFMETIDDVEGSASSLAKGAKRAPLS